MPARAADGPQAADHPDPVDRLVEQWASERPDLDLAPMATFGRLGRLAALATAAIEAELGRHDLTVADFDVLATLRRAGEPCALRPGEVARALMLSPAGMTGRLDRLERAGLVERSPDPDDRRSWIVRLSEAGRRSVDAAVADHVANEARLLAPLSAAQHAALDDALRTLLASLEPGADGSADEPTAR